jgi:putative transcriptional regulator
MLPTVFVPVQSKNAKALAAGELLVASRGLADPHFAKTVVLLVHYDDQDVVGLILNRRTDIPLSRVLEGLEAAKGRSDPVYLGGPVEGKAVFALFQSPSKIEEAEHLFGGVYFISEKTLFEKTISTRPDPGVFRVYLGYAGWKNVQLQKELELGAWFIFPADVSTVFSADPDSLWSQMIQKTELRLARTEPADAGPSARPGTGVFCARHNAGPGFYRASRYRSSRERSIGRLGFISPAHDFPVLGSRMTGQSWPFIAKLSANLFDDDLCSPLRGSRQILDALVNGCTHRLEQFNPRIREMVAHSRGEPEAGAQVIQYFTAKATLKDNSLAGRIRF